MRGIYIIANDKVIDQAIALLNSIRLHDADTPIMMIPYDDNYQAIAELLTTYYGVQIYPDLEFIDRVSNKLHQIFGGEFFAHAGEFVKLASFGDGFEGVDVGDLEGGVDESDGLGAHSRKLEEVEHGGFVFGE